MNKLALLPLALVACTSSGSDSSGDDDDSQLTVAGLQTEQSIIDRADFSTATSIPTNTPPAVSVTITDNAARQLFSDTLALPLLPPGGYACPADFGITYFVTFYDYSPDALPITATITPAGCQTATITTKAGSITFITNPNYWAQVANDLGITESKIFPYTPPND
jgi:hypothetical protein